MPFFRTHFFLSSFFLSSILLFLWKKSFFFLYFLHFPPQRSNLCFVSPPLMRPLNPAGARMHGGRVSEENSPSPSPSAMASSEEAAVEPEPPQMMGRVKREPVAKCLTCPLCHKLLRDATTISMCLHTCSSPSSLLLLHDILLRSWFQRCDLFYFFGVIWGERAWLVVTRMFGCFWFLCFVVPSLLCMVSLEVFSIVIRDRWLLFFWSVPSLQCKFQVEFSWSFQA